MKHLCRHVIGGPNRPGERRRILAGPMREEFRMRDEKMIAIIVFAWGGVVVGQSWGAGTARAGANPGPEAESFALANGVNVVVLSMPGSEHVSIFTYLPMGLAWDGPGRAQWSHLIEHLTIRSTVPFGSKQANAETLPDHMRLDFYGTVENWRDGLSHHARWLEGMPFREKSLQGEKRRVNTECDVVARRLATHKFALAAWAQGYRHGQGHAGIKGDVDRATLEEIQQYRDERQAVLDKVVICVVGGLDAKAVKPVIVEKLGTIQSKAASAKPVKAHRVKGAMTWDIDARHLVLAWAIPEATDKDYAALMVAGNLLTMRFFSDAELKGLTGFVLAGADLTVPEGNFFYVSASVKPKASFEEVRKKIGRHIALLRSDASGLGQAAMIGRQLAGSLTTLPDPATLKAQVARHVPLSMIEGQIGLRWGMYEYRYGKERSALAGRLGSITAEQVCQAAEKYLPDEKCTTCALSPGQDVKGSASTKPADLIGGSSSQYSR